MCYISALTGGVPEYLETIKMRLFSSPSRNHVAMKRRIHEHFSFKYFIECALNVPGPPPTRCQEADLSFQMEQLTCRLAMSRPF